MTTELRHGRWQDVLADIERCDAVICDPPYSEKTHVGRRTGSEVRSAEIDYQPLDAFDPGEFVAHWFVRATWFVIFGDHVTNQWWSEALDSVGLYVFAPIPWVKTDAPPRMCGDGPASQTEWITVARQHVNTRNKRSRPGHYVGPTSSTRGATYSTPGCKPLWLMRALVRDYSERGDLIIDPYAGSGTTLVAAATEGRNAIGAEMDQARFDRASRRVMQGVTPSLFAEGA